jgi:hypothetical protein
MAQKLLTWVAVPGRAGKRSLIQIVFSSQQVNRTHRNGIEYRTIIINLMPLHIGASRRMEKLLEPAPNLTAYPAQTASKSSLPQCGNTLTVFPYFISP